MGINKVTKRSMKKITQISINCAYLAVAVAEACLGPTVDHAADPCQDTSALHWGACYGAAGVGCVGQTEGFGVFFRVLGKISRMKGNNFLILLL